MLLRCFWKAPSVRRNVVNIPGVMESWQLQKYFMLRQSKQNKCIIWWVPCHWKGIWIRCLWSLRDHLQSRVDGSGRKVQLEQSWGELTLVFTVPQTGSVVTGNYRGPGPWGGLVQADAGLKLSDPQCYLVPKQVLTATVSVFYQELVTRRSPLDACIKCVFCYGRFYICPIPHVCRGKPSPLPGLSLTGHVQNLPSMATYLHNGPMWH